MQKQKLILLLSELAIPVLGFYLWNWNLYFILLFYCFDMIGNEISLHLKAKKIAAYTSDLQVGNWRVFGIISAMLLILNIVFIHIGMFAIHEDFNIKESFFSFLSYKEMGIQQGYILIPLIGAMAYSQYYTDFVVKQTYKTIRFKELFKRNFQLKFAILIFAVTISLIALALHPSEQILLWSILIPVSIVNWINKN